MRLRTATVQVAGVAGFAAEVRGGNRGDGSAERVARHHDTVRWTPPLLGLDGRLDFNPDLEP